MMKGSKRKQRRLALAGDYALEVRALLSQVGRSNLVLSSAHVSGLPQVNQPAVHHAVARLPSADRVANQAGRHPAGAGILPTSGRWSWLANTYWYVPVPNLPATLYNSATGTVTSVSDQTVFHITTYREGYFWGDVVTQLNSGSPSSSFMVGSVTPEGKVLLTFTSTGSQSSPSITNGYGTMEHKFGAWTMENQMFTSPTERLQIGHWAYMVQTRPGKASWYSLPSAGVSVPEFLSQ
jgi:hypothetical protein